MSKTLGHSIEWTVDDGLIHGTATCHEPEGADCRLTADCECESWTIERDTDGRPFHFAQTFYEGDVEPRIEHPMRPYDRCTVVEWLEEDDPAELATSPVIIARTLIRAVWRDGRMRWTPLPAIGWAALSCGFDPEQHAVAYNHGYEDAVTQGLADDPSLAGDWLTAQKAAVWVEAANSITTNCDQQTEEYGPCDDCAAQAEALLARNPHQLEAAIAS